MQEKGVIHRDLKPANILKAKNKWKIADFGFAILGKSEMKTKANVGTPLYMPLESLKDNIYSPESDIFSVGVILYELLAGITPWESNSEKQLMKKMETVKIESIIKNLITSP
jgi:serine/threonine protein kinase